MAKLRRALVKPEDWQRHMRVLEKLAAPKVVRPKKKKRVRDPILAHESVLIDLDKNARRPPRQIPRMNRSIDRVLRCFRLRKKNGDQ